MMAAAAVYSVLLFLLNQSMANLTLNAVESIE